MLSSADLRTPPCSNGWPHLLKLFQELPPTCPSPPKWNRKNYRSPILALQPRSRLVFERYWRVREITDRTSGSSNPQENIRCRKYVKKEFQPPRPQLVRVRPRPARRPKRPLA